MLALNKDISSERLDLSNITNSVPNIDLLGCKLVLNYFVAYLFIVYIPPSTSITNAEVETFFELLSSVELILHKNVIFLGDFNIPSFSSPLPIGSRHNNLLHLSEFLHLKQYNTIPNCNNRFLDLVLANLKIGLEQCDTPLVQEDPYHPALIFDFLGSLPHVPTFPVNNDGPPQFNFRKTDYPTLYELMLNTDWSPVTVSHDVASACKNFYDILNNNFAACTPLKSPRRRRFPPWFTKELICNIFKKEKVLRHLRTQESPYYLQKFKALRRLIKSQSKQAYKDFVANAELNINTNPSNFWSFIQNKKAQSRIPATMKYTNRPFHGP